MKNVREITGDELNSIKVVTFDIDGVIIPVGTDLRENEDGTELYMKSKRLSPCFLDNIKKLKKYVRLNFSSGRNILYLKSLVNEFFDNQTILQAENGNITWLYGKIVHPTYDDVYFDQLRDIKENLKKIMKSDKRIRGFEPKLFIVTVHSDEMPEIPELVKKMDPESKLYCLWTNEGYDIGRKSMDKGLGILFLAQELGIKEKQIMTTGNNYNDRGMLEAGLGVSVNPEKVRAEYFVETKEGELGGEVLAEFLLKHYSSKR